MERVDFTFKRGGRTKLVTSAQAKVLSRAGLGTYQTRDMARQTMLTNPMQAEPISSGDIVPGTAQHEVAEQDIKEQPGAFAATDDLEGMDKEQLHALAKQRGVKVHHMAGADKVRAALREAQE